MKFIKWFKHPQKDVFEVYKTKILSEIKIEPGDTVLAFNDNGTSYGICGAVYATQVDFSRQIQDKTNPL